MILITKKELEALEQIRRELNKLNYILHSEKTGILYRIINRRRNFKWFVKQLFK